MIKFVSLLRQQGPSVWIYVILLLSFLTNLTQSQTINQNSNQQLTEIALRQISNGSERFSLELFKGLSALLPNHNLIVSPFSVWSLLILTAEGAAENTYNELQKVLGLPEDLTHIRDGYKHIQNAFKVNTSTIELALNQVLFTDINRPIYAEYEDILNKYYEADYKGVRFDSPADAFNTINDYVGYKTGGKLGNVVNENDLKEAQMLLISAIYFRGQWQLPFNLSETRVEPFYDESGNVIGNVDMMYQKAPFVYTSLGSINSYVLELPYGKEQRLSMIIILPKKGFPLITALEQLATVGMSAVTNQLAKSKQDFDDEDVEVFLPRFTIKSDFTLNGPLNQMGLWDLFDKARANLSKMMRSDAYLSRIIHKAKIEVNEEGTIASASTAGIFANKNSPPRFYANRPFGYLIVEKTTNIVLFCGHMKKPEK